MKLHDTGAIHCNSGNCLTVKMICWTIDTKDSRLGQSSASKVDWPYHWHTDLINGPINVTC